MDKDPVCFPLIPASTVRAARTLYGRGNIYLRLGDRLNELLADFDRRSIVPQLEEENALLFCLLTIIQYVEKLADAELAASIQQRMDLRYAVHLATPSPRLDPAVLCAFRCRLLTDREGREMFRRVFQLVYPEIINNTSGEQPSIDDVLGSICENEVRTALMEAMLRSMEALSANHFHWLRQIALPHWYQRYHRSMAVSDSTNLFGKQELTREDMQRDIQHLLYEIDRSNLPDIMEMRETKQLILIRAQLTDPTTPKTCHQCIITLH